jgi:hypothetical protein
LSCRVCLLFADHASIWIHMSAVAGARGGAATPTATRPRCARGYSPSIVSASSLTRLPSPGAGLDRLAGSPVRGSTDTSYGTRALRRIAHPDHYLGTEALVMRAGRCSFEQPGVAVFAATARERRSPIWRSLIGDVSSSWGGKTTGPESNGLHLPSLTSLPLLQG